MRHAILDSDGLVVNIVEVDPVVIVDGGWAPPASHSVFKALTSEGDSLKYGDKADLQTGLLVERVAVPAPVELPVAAILVYGKDENAPQDQFEAADTINIKVTLPATIGTRTIAVPIDRLNATNDVIQPAALWMKLDLVAGVGSISKVFPTGRFGVGRNTSIEFEVPETRITVFS